MEVYVICAIALQMKTWKEPFHKSRTVCVVCSSQSFWNSKPCSKAAKSKAHVSRTSHSKPVFPVHALGPQLTLSSSKASRYFANMVKTRKNQPVVTALAASHPAVVPVVSALSEETVPEKAPATETCEPSTSDEADVSRPVRVYADGKPDEQRLNASSQSGRRANTSLIFRHLRSVSFWTRQGIRAG